MKYIMFSILLFAIFRANAQQTTNNPADEMVTITTPSASVSKWFDLIEEKGIILSYNPSVIDLELIRRVETRMIKIGKLLKTILPDYTLKLIFVEPRKLIIQAEKKKIMLLLGKSKKRVLWRICTEQH